MTALRGGGTAPFSGSDQKITLTILAQAQLYPGNDRLLVLMLFTLIGVGPMPITSVIGIYIVLARPEWFKVLVERIYQGKS